MSTRERILAIRLLEKVREYPAYAKALGIEAVKEKLTAPAEAGFQAAGTCRK